MSNAYMCWLIAMPDEYWVTSMSKKYLSEPSHLFEIFKKMSFEMLNTLCNVSRDNNVNNIYHKKDATTDGGMKEENRVICFTSSHTKLYKGRAEATKSSTLELFQPIKRTTKAIKSLELIGTIKPRGWSI